MRRGCSVKPCHSRQSDLVQAQAPIHAPLSFAFTREAGETNAFVSELDATVSAEGGVGAHDKRVYALHARPVRRKKNQNKGYTAICASVTRHKRIYVHIIWPLADHA
jgi:hypothetical protein